MKEANQTQICEHAPATYDEHTTRSPRSTVSVYLVCFFPNDSYKIVY